MPYQHKPNRGSIFKADPSKFSNPSSAPTHTGSCCIQIDGKEYNFNIACWPGESNGRKRLDLAYTLKEQELPPETPEEKKAEEDYFL